MNLQLPASAQTYVTVNNANKIYDAIDRFRASEISPC